MVRITRRAALAARPKHDRSRGRCGDDLRCNDDLRPAYHGARPQSSCTGPIPDAGSGSRRLTRGAQLPYRRARPSNERNEPAQLPSGAATRSSATARRGYTIPTPAGLRAAVAAHVQERRRCAHRTREHRQRCRQRRPAADQAHEVTPITAGEAEPCPRRAAASEGAPSGLCVLRKQLGVRPQAASYSTRCPAGENASSFK